MTGVLQTVEGGLVVAALYLLIGQSWNVVFGSCGYLNLAVGEMFVLAGVLCTKAPDVFNVGPVMASALAVVALGVLGLAAERLLIRPLADNGLSVLLVTVGLALILGAAIQKLAPEVALQPADLWQGPPFFVGGVVIPRQHVVILAVAVLSSLALLVFFHATNLGRTFRACADDRRAARALGVDVARVGTGAFVIGAVVVALAAVVAAPLQGVAAGAGSAMAIKAFLAVSLVGMGRYGAAAIGAVVVGVGEALVARYVSSDVSDLVVLFALVVTLAIRPSEKGAFS